MIVIPVTGLTAAAAWIVPLLVDTTDPGDRIEVIRIALTVGAGTGGVVALVLAGRRQWSNEQAHKVTEHDATERRITELYTKAVDQLGSEHAAVRLGGLYALERLANTTPTQQGAIGSVICAYLRMPYSNPLMSQVSENREDQKEYNRLIQELEPRRTALEILIRHNRSTDPQTHWPTMHVRLQRANLNDTDLTDADLTVADLTAACLIRARLPGADLTHAILASADLTQANLVRARLFRANLSHAHLVQADLRHAVLTFADLRGADLRNADLTDADLTGSDLTGASVTGVNLTDEQRQSARWEEPEVDEQGFPLMTTNETQNETPDQQ